MYLKGKNMFINTMTAVKIDDQVLFTESNFNALFQMDLNDYVPKYLFSFHEYQKYEAELFLKSCMADNSIFFLPFCGDKLAVYKMDEAIIEYIDLASIKRGYTLDFCTDGMFLWIITNDFPNEIVKIDLCSNAFTKHKMDWNKIIDITGSAQNKMTVTECQHVMLYSRINEKKCWMISRIKGHILYYDFNTQETGVIIIPGFEDCRFQELEIDSHYVWITLMERNTLLRFDLWEYQVTDVINFMLSDNNPQYGGYLLSYEKYIILTRVNGIVLLEKESMQRKEFPFTKKIQLLCHIVYQGKIIFFSNIGHKIIELDLQKKEIKEIEFKWKLNLEENTLFDLFGGYVNEADCSLKDFLDALPQKKESSIHCKAVGDDIWEAMAVKE